MLSVTHLVSRSTPLLVSSMIVKTAMATAILLASATAYADFNHSSWDSLLNKNVTMTNSGKASVVNYASMKADKSKLDSYMDATSKVSQSEFNAWSKDEQLAFLINVYNAGTVELVLTKYPNIKSIKDIGGVFGSPWKQNFISLLGKTRSLDDIEHNLIRGSKRYNEPRIHFAVNCASIGCPALLNDAFTASKLDKQLEQVTSSFLADTSRNRLKGNTLEVSPIFKWYKEDFATSWRGTYDLAGFLARYSTSLGLNNGQAAQLRNGKIKIGYSSYNWNLNKK
ncbi:DUF547 domain-containing protein [Psychrobacter sp. TAE2020]|uniref:DUF547 domain-containing protein n=1 Tax=Psychrobacter sp. TAE2020 TaxID=2846762 RepID=UPI001C1293C4|nr:DUF547 domain-containing protein [Psychrobacter sp. TAE2020]MBU5617948.1 DUF547 domain-containing protein [Psychrobacter sp. TAE2020]